MHEVQPGDVLVAEMTDPDWEPVMKRAAAIVTNRGGRTCHAAIIARELGVPAVVGSGDATERVPDGASDRVLRRGRGRLRLQGCSGSSKTIELTAMPEIPVKIMMNVGNPEQAFAFATAQRGGRPGAAGVHHQQRHRHPSQGAAGLSTSCPRT